MIFFYTLFCSPDSAVLLSLETLKLQPLKFVSFRSQVLFRSLLREYNIITDIIMRDCSALLDPTDLSNFAHCHDLDDMVLNLSDMMTATMVSFYIRF